MITREPIYNIPTKVPNTIQMYRYTRVCAAEKKLEENYCAINNIK